MKKRLKLLAFAAPLVLLPGCATASAPAPATTAAAAQPSGPALWKVADEDTTIYLFGTVHALPKDIEWYNGPVAQALTASQSLVTEIPPGVLKEPATQQKFLSAGMLPEGKSLRDMLSPDQRAKFEAAMTKQGLPVGAFDKLEPWFAALTLSTIPLLKAGYTMEAGVESAVEAKAGTGVKRDALETVEGQLALFDTLPVEGQVAYLIAVTEQLDNTVPVMNEMVAAWAKGDADRLAAIMNEAMDDPAIADRLLYARNRNWADWVDKRLDQPGTVFVAVGAGHLAGPNSLQDYLTKAGTKVTRVQ